MRSTRHLVAHEADWLQGYDSIAGTYTEMYADERSLAESRLIYRRAERAVDGGLLVDVGCADGIALNWLDGKCNYLGVDVSEKMIEAAKRCWPEHVFMQGTLADLERNVADFVLGAFGPLIHIDDVQGFAREVERVLWPSRRFLVMAASRGVVRATGALRVTHDAATLHDAFFSAGLRQVNVYGLRWIGRPLLSRVRPDGCEWLVVEGEKAPR